MARELIVLILLVSFSTWAFGEDLDAFFKQVPKACRENAKVLGLGRDFSSVAVLRCLDDQGRPVSSCKLGRVCGGWYFEIYLNNKRKHELDHKATYELIHKSYPTMGDRPTLTSANGIVSLKSSFRHFSQAREEDKFRFEGGKLKLVGIEYSMVMNGGAVGEDEPYQYNFSINTLTENVLQTDFYPGPKLKKHHCKMNAVFKNLTIADQVTTTLENLSCEDE